MIAVSIALGVWTLGLQIVQRRSERNRPESALAQSLSPEVEKQIVNEEQKV
jgi:hypothetical protein